MLLSPAITLGVFAFTLFLSATLLFVVELMTGKMILPLLGGTPAVWNTCMLFYQLALLAGYLYAHVAPKWLDAPKQIIAQLVLLGLAIFFLPVRVSEGLAPAGDANQVFGVLFLLLVSVGLPFFVISTTAPLLQKWFASTNHPSAGDPYFLYAASNVGSMLALLIYPMPMVGIEPNLALRFQSAHWLSQSGLWTLGYGVLALFAALCGYVLWTTPRPALETAGEKASGKWAPSEAGARGARGITAARPPETARRAKLDPAAPASSEISSWDKLHWIALAFIPSSLMLGATTYITTDIAAIPLLWVPPLALYLLSFILVFSRLPDVVHKAAGIALPLLILLQIFIMMSNLGKLPMWGKIGIHLLVLFVTAMVCHGELARRRPSTKHLTEFYLLMSIGGVLGGVFNALIAPVIFNSIVEYPLVMAIACLMLPRSPDEGRGSEARFKDFGYPAALGVLALVLISGVLLFDLNLKVIFRLFPSDLDDERSLLAWLVNNYQQIEGSFVKIVRYGVPVVICYTFVDRPLRLALGVGAILFAFHFVEQSDPSILKQKRSFFGVLQVSRDKEEPQFHKLTHGTTLHGTQRHQWDGRTASAFLRNFTATLGLSSTDSFNAVAYMLGAEVDYWEGREPEWLDPRREALTYYHRTGPIGQVMRVFRGPDKRKKHIAVIGLGTGTMASYIEPGQRLTYYDIDKHVVEIAQDKQYFTYWIDAVERGAILDAVVLGDARVEMRKAVLDENNSHYQDRYGVMVIDAFSSDAIPVHLITLEAIRDVYLPKLEDGGIIAFHVSNRHLDLEPVLGNLAKHLKLKAIVQNDGREEEHPGKAASTWVLLARDDKDFGELNHESRLKWEEQPELTLFVKDLPDTGFWSRSAARAILTQRPQWAILKGDDKVGIWTDDFSNVLSIWNR